MTDLPNKTWFRPREVAEYLSLHRKTIYLWVNEGKIDAVRLIGKTIRIHRNEIKRVQKMYFD